METPFCRTEMLLGVRALRALASSRVAVFGLGGVGSWAAEALARGAVGSLLLVDSDVVTPGNLNRQLHANHDTIARYKTQLMRARALAINPDAHIETDERFCLPDNVSDILRGRFDYVVDAVDTVAAKIALVLECRERGIPIISCMGTGNKLDPARFKVADLFETSMCPLCRVMRRELRARGVDRLRVVYSDEPPLRPVPPADQPAGRRIPPGSVSFVPPVAGMIAAGQVIRDLAGVGHPENRPQH